LHRIFSAVQQGITLVPLGELLAARRWELKRPSAAARIPAGTGDEPAVRVHLLDMPATPAQLTDMLEAHGSFIKLAVDVERGVVAGGGDYHADCEEALLADGSEQEDVWGADWHPGSRDVTFSALINVRPRQDNPSLNIRDRELRRRVEKVVRGIFDVEER
jgi:hypothetical protein